MKEYICTVCGYVHKTEGELPEDFVCPICGAGKDAFKLKEDTQKAETTLEKPHEERYRALLKNVETKAVFEKSGVTIWECRNCGHIVVGTKAPEICPVCNHPQAYFEVHKENY